uniref:AAA family ATPase n=1 Tax=Ornithinicoccus halotolerans TaxID=1748220 RepID=UPI0012970F89
MVTHWPLTGRDEQLTELVELLRRPSAAPTGAVLAGPSGVGKTRLAREALAALAEAGVGCQWMVASEASRALPFGPFWRLARGFDADGSDTSGRLAEVLAATARERAVLGMDDAHLLDDQSASLLLSLAVEHGVPLLLTLRTGAPASDAVRALWKDGYLSRFDLPELAPQQVGALLEQALGGAVETHSVRRLHALTGGNALALRAVVEGALTEGRLSRTGRLWQLRGEATVTPALAEVLQARLDQLTPEVRAVLEVLSLAEPLDVATLRQVTGDGAVEEAERAGAVVVEERTGRPEVRAAHPLLSELVRARVGTLRARRLRSRLVRALDWEHSPRPGDLLRAAVLLLDSDTAPDPGLLVPAAEHALQVCDVRLAERLALAAVRDGHGGRAAAALGHALSWQDRPADAERVLAPFDVPGGPDDERAAVALIRAANLFWTGDEAAGAEEVLRRARQEVSDPGCHAVLASMQLCFTLSRNRPQQVIADGRALVEALAEEGRALPWGGSAVGLALARTGRCQDAIDLVTRQLDLLGDGPEPRARQLVLDYAHVTACVLAGHPEQAELATGHEYPLSLTAGWVPHLTGLMRGLVAADRGELGRAAGLLQESADGLAGEDPSRWRFVALCWLAQVRAVRGEAAAARAALGEAEAERRDCHDCYDPDLLLTRAWVAAAEGAVSDAQVLATCAAATARVSGQHAVESVALHTAVRFGSTRPTARLAELARGVDGDRAGADACDVGAGVRLGQAVGPE